MKLKVYRTGPSSSPVRYDTFDLPASPGATVLSLLFEARDQFDDSLAFRYSCRGAVCGSCAMLINNVPRLACRTLVEPLLGRGHGGQGFQGSGQPDPSIPRTPEPDSVLVEPLPHLPVLRDLVVDMTKFFRFLQAVRPVLRPAAAAPEREFRMEPAAVKELERYTNCILCGACYGACPVCGENPEYLGPAALAQLYRFHIDPRESRGLTPLPADENGASPQSRLALADKPDGWWACRFYTNCRKVCPKGVPPNLAIGQARQELGAGHDPIVLNPDRVPGQKDQAEGSTDAQN
jgi:succinate dehydrogenase / fumarate reductase, iron-sulfur subunit